MPLTDSALLRTIPLFAQLSDQERQELAGLLKIRTYQPNQPVIWIGDSGADFYIIQSGRVIVSVPDETGNEIEIAVLKPGHFFGEISLLDGGPRTTSCRAEGELTLMVLGRDEFLSFLKTKPSAAIHIMTVLAQRTRDMLDKIRGIRNVNEEADSKLKPLQRFVDKAAAAGASHWFLIVNLTFIIVWIAIQTFLYSKPIVFRDDPPTFFWLGFMITLEASLLTIFVLNSQKRSAERDRIRADLDYQVNVKAHLEVVQLHQKVDRLQAALVEIKAAAMANSVAKGSPPGVSVASDAAAPVDSSRLSVSRS